MKFENEEDYLLYWAQYTNRGGKVPDEIVQPRDLSLGYLVATELNNYGDWGEFAIFEFEDPDGMGGTVVVPTYNLGLRSLVERSTDREMAVAGLTPERRAKAREMAQMYRSAQDGPYLNGYFGNSLSMMENSISNARPLHHLLWSTLHTIEDVDVSSFKDAVRRWYADKTRRFWGNKKLDDHYLEWAAATLFWLDWKKIYRVKHQTAVWQMLAQPSQARLLQLMKNIWSPAEIGSFMP